MSKRIDNGEHLLCSFPYALSRDDDKNAVAESIVDELAQTAANAEMAKIFPAINELPEAVLDMLAYDLKVEWYDFEGELSEKRTTIRECMKIHKFKGTKAAIITALKSVYDDVKIFEWFEYGGEPYHFKIHIKHSHSGYAKLARLLQKVKYYKNLRSHLEETIFEIDLTPPPINVFVGTFSKGIQREDGARVTCDIPSIPTLKSGLFVAVRAGSEYREIGAVASVNIPVSDLSAKLNAGYFLFAKEKSLKLPEVSYYGLESNND